jgi:hypothetical protein
VAKLLKIQAIMQFSHYKIATLFLTLFSLTILRGQDGKASIELDRDEQLQYTYYAKNSGLWVFTNTNIISAQAPPCKVYKFSPDLSKQEWTADMKGISSKAIYDEKSPDFVYFRAGDLPTNQLFNTTKLRFFQLNKLGKIRTYEIQKEKEEDADYDISAFTSMGNFCDIWTKKKAANDLILVLHDNETFKRTVKTIKIPSSSDKMKYGIWRYAGASDNMLALTRHESDKNERIQVILIDMKLGKVTNEFTYKPSFNPSSTKVGSCYFDRDGEKASDIYQKEASAASSTGDIKLSKTGKYFYHYGLINYDKPMKNQLNFVWAELDLDGKQLQQEELTYNSKELTVATAAGILRLDETSDNKFEMHLLTGGGMTTLRVALLLSSDGKIRDRCIKDSQIKVSMRGAKSSVNSIDDLYPCFIKNPDRISEYIIKKKFDGGYGVISDENHHVVTINLPKDRVIGLIYFNK